MQNRDIRLRASESRSSRCNNPGKNRAEYDSFPIQLIEQRQELELPKIENKTLKSAEVHTDGETEEQLPWSKEFQFNEIVLRDKVRQLSEDLEKYCYLVKSKKDKAGVTMKRDRVLKQKKLMQHLFTFS